MPMNHRLLRPLQTPGLLDLVPGAAAAYSLRSLSRSYAGPVVTVRRSSDDAEDSFTAAEVADGTLAAFCGAGDGFVKTLFDQSGNTGRDATQTTAGYQPKIVSSGVVILEEGKPAIQFDGSDDLLPISDSSVLDLPATVFAVFTHSPSSDERYIFARQLSGSNGGVILRQDNATELVSLQTIDAASPYPAVSFAKKTGQDLVVAISAPPNSSIYSSFVLQDTDASTSGFTNASHSVAIGSRPDASNKPWDSKIQEIIVYPSDLSEQRELVEGLIAWGYSV